ncbi:MAG: hypothetical protein AAFU54_30735 [Chloroflexota bacterium]
MPSINHIDALVIAIYTLSLFWAVLGVTIFLERKRQVNLPHYFAPAISLSVGVGRKHRLPPRIVTQELRRVRLPAQGDYPANRRNPLLEHGTATQSQQARHIEQIVIHIEPDGTPSEERQTIQRLIDHLQTPADKIAS